GEIVGHHADGPAEDRADSGDDAVGRRLGLAGAGEEPVLLELGPGVEQKIEPVADEELALGSELVAVLDVPLTDARALVPETPVAHARHGSTAVRRAPARAAALLFAGSDRDDQDARLVRQAADERRTSRRNVHHGCQLTHRTVLDPDQDAHDGPPDAE